MADMMNMDGSGWDEDMFDDMTSGATAWIRKIVFLIDRSGSMDGTTIGTINSVMEEILSELDDDDIRIAVAETDEKIEWKTDSPVSVRTLGSWERTRSGSFSNLGAMFSELAANLKKKDWNETGTKGVKNYFILFSDGLATDEYREPLKKLTELAEFKSGKRLSVTFSDLNNGQLLFAFAGDKKQVVDGSGSGAIDRVEQAILEMLKE